MTDAPTSLLAVESRISVLTLAKGALTASGKIRMLRNATVLNGPKLEAVGWRRGRNFIGLRVKLLAIGRPGRGCLGVVNIMHTGVDVAEARA